MRFQLSDIIKHTGVIIILLMVLLLPPLVKTGVISGLIRGEEAVSGATVSVDNGDDGFIILINNKIQKDENSREDWVDFFKGDYVKLPKTSISCSIAKDDLAGLVQADKYKSYFTEDEFGFYEDNGTLMLSRVDNGQFDIVIMSMSYAREHKAAKDYGSKVTTIYIKGATE